MFQFSTILDKIYRIDVYTGSFDAIDLSKVSQSYGIILNTQNEILICYNSDSGFWILPGGTVEQGETTIDTLIREVYEESAVVVDQNTIKTAFYQKIYKLDESGQNGEFYTLQVRYIARPTRIDKFISDPGGNMTEVKWLPINQLDEYLKWGETNNLIKKIAKEYIDKSK